MAMQCRCQYMKLCITVKTQYFSKLVSSTFCIAYGVEGKRARNTVDRILLHYILILLETNILR